MGSKMFPSTISAREAGFIEKSLSHFVVILLLIACYTSYTDRILSRNAFFSSLGLYVLYVVFYKNKNLINLNRKSFLFSLSIMLMGAAQLLWHYINKNNTADYSLLANKTYSVTGEYLVFFSLSFLFASGNTLALSENSKKHIIPFISVSGFLYMTLACLSDFYQNPDARLSISSAATTTAYAITFQSLVTMFIAGKSSLPYNKVILSGIFLITVILLCLSETRSALLCYPLCIFLIYKNTIKKHFVASLLLLLIFFAITLSFSGVSDRIIEGYNNIATYPQNNNTSIGARVSMFKGGVNSFISHPFGQSAETRNNNITQYIEKNEKGNPGAIDNIKYHLHNDFIEIISLQGIIGGGIFLFYLTALHTFLAEKSSIAYITLPVILFGISDVLFIFPRLLIIILSCIMLMTILTTKSR